MKWTNRGHELDEVGKRYVGIKNMYIWGTGYFGTLCYEFLNWLKLTDEFVIKFVDLDIEKQKCKFNGFEVISPSSLFEVLSVGNANTESVVVVTPFLENKKIIDECEKNNVQNLFNWHVMNHIQTNSFIQHFMCIWLAYKHNKLLSHWMDFVITTYCNLNCRGCVNFNEYITKPEHTTFEEFKAHIDIIFSKYDYLYSFHFTGGEPFLNKYLYDALAYLSETYGDRIHDLFIITNGTIIPDEKMLSLLKETNCWLQIDDYRKTVPIAVDTIPKLEVILKKKEIKYSFVKAETWFDLALYTADNSHLSEEELIQWRDDCDIFLQTFKDGKVYSCCRTSYAETAGISSESDNEYLNIQSSSKIELLEFRMGYTAKGYVDFCKHCMGVGKNAVLIPAAEQVKKHNCYTGGEK